jgi:hypothetical protein
MLAFLHVFFAIRISSFEKDLFSSFVHFFIGSLFWGSLVFWAPLYSGYQSLVRCITGKDFLSFFSSLYNLQTISLLCRSFLISCSPICQSFLLVAEPFRFYWRSHCLCLLILVYSLFFTPLVLKGCLFSITWFRCLCQKLGKLSCLDSYLGLLFLCRYHADFVSTIWSQVLRYLQCCSFCSVLPLLFMVILDYSLL